MTAALLCWAFVAFASNPAHAFTISSAAHSPQHRPQHIVARTKLHATMGQGIAVNPLLADVKLSKTIEVFATVKEMEAEGIDVTSLCVGEPDFPPPRAVLDATIQAVEGGETRYTAVTGTAQLRAAIAEDLRGRKGLDYKDTEILVSNGAKQSVYQGVLAFCGPGDEVLIPAPFWPSYPEMVALTGAKPVIVPTTIEDGFLVDPAKLEGYINDNTKLMIFCNPSNPTGAVHSKGLQEGIAEVMKRHPQIAILSDEIYERLVYNDENPHVSFASIEGMYDRTMTVNGFSKAYAMTGMRLGYMAAPAKLLKPCVTIQSQLTSCAGSLSQAGGLAALTKVTETEMESNVKIMKEKRDYVVKRLSNISGLKYFVPDGAFYILPDVSAWFGGDDTEFCLALLKEKALALVPGSSFGADGTVRLSYATSIEELTVAMDKLEAFMEEKR
ncbi:hypothetical protein TrVE_jg4639 [Triparma verrucosa]|uniref:Aminotransferase class I/classII large domain-containing protein n=2 Tax=Triparma TaxID=722752 RepID=A0A9W7F2V2_9STRA|nr:hypothetical protein TrST_g9334 [Triparma strigata]GMI01899.1 hypothetical protein TrVE_jg4639 [Triparma verrucosa]